MELFLSLLIREGGSIDTENIFIDRKDRSIDKEDSSIDTEKETIDRKVKTKCVEPIRQPLSKKQLNQRFKELVEEVNGIVQEVQELKSILEYK